jgi:hypothetical protein
MANTDSGSVSSAAAPTSRRDYWQEVIEECRQSGLRQAEFCRQRGIKRRSLSFWKWKLEARKWKLGSVSDVSQRPFSVPSARPVHPCSRLPAHAPRVARHSGARQGRRELGAVEVGTPPAGQPADGDRGAGGWA